MKNPRHVDRWVVPGHLYFVTPNLLIVRVGQVSIFNKRFKLIVECWHLTLSTNNRWAWSLNAQSVQENQVAIN